MLCKYCDAVCDRLDNEKCLDETGDDETTETATTESQQVSQAADLNRVDR